MNKTDKEYIKELEGLIKYQYGFDLLMDYFDVVFTDDEKQEIDKRLKEVGL